MKVSGSMWEDGGIFQQNPYVGEDASHAVQTVCWKVLFALERKG
jgi:hypothetical protein